MVIDLSPYKKIGISGSHGIGKTTLAKRISTTFDFPYLMEVARELLNYNLYFDWKKKGNIEIKLIFEKAIFYSHLFLINQPKFISDRTVLDIFAYSVFHLKREYNENFNNFLNYVIDYIHKVGEMYDLILFYINGYKEMDNEGKFIHDIISNVINQYNLNNVINIAKGDVLMYNNFALYI